MALCQRRAQTIAQLCALDKANGITYFAALLAPSAPGRVVLTAGLLPASAEHARFPAEDVHEGRLLVGRANQPRLFHGCGYCSGERGRTPL